MCQTSVQELLFWKPIIQDSENLINSPKHSIFFFFSVPPLTREADLDISDSETKQENKLQIIRTLGIKTQNPGFRTGHSLGNAC